MIKISIVIPTYNESANIKQLLKRIDQAFVLHQIPYEIIIIDDHSIDTTLEIATSLKNKYPISIFLKSGQKGKSFSLLEGFSKASGEYIAMIDADLQYPPEMLPFMLQECEGDSDIVVARRKSIDLSVSRDLMSKTFQYIFGKLLHGMSYDIQSGMKVFKKEILERINITPTQWTFDMEFLLKAEEAGYTISNYDITFKKRSKGTSSIHPIASSFEIGLSALSLKTRERGVIPFTKKERERKGSGFSYKGKEYVHYSQLSLENTAFFQLTRQQKIDAFLLLLILILSGILSLHLTLLVVLSVITLYYFSDLLLSLLLISKSLLRSKKLDTNQPQKIISDDDLPTYTILCPLYKEMRIVRQFLSSIKKLSYPKEKLQVLLLLEEDDKESRDEIQSFILPSFVEVIIVPDSKPKTKPKACNYGLAKATGEYVVIYDAEDVPDRDQLKKVVNEFSKSPRDVVCVQAKLSFYNPTQNILTRFFTAEYALWFDLILPGLQSLGAPIPLGGTSNHFRTSTLRKLGGWDSFNVTEDCDLGMRIARSGYQTAIIDSVTLEEANSNLLSWINQRSRWIKGYIQTYLVQLRTTTKPQSPVRFFTFLHFTVGGKILSLFINPLMWILTISYFALKPLVGESIHTLFPPQIYYLGILSLIFGNFLYLYYYMIGLIQREEYGLIKYVFFIPFYWLIMSIAALRAVIQMVSNPHYWAKTKHGLHLSDQPVQVSTNKKSTITLDIPYIPI